MAIIYSYPTVIPTADDLVLGTDVNQTDKPTKNFTIQSIVDIVQGGATGLGAVLAISADALQQPATNFTNIQGSGAVTFGSFTDGTMNMVGGVGTGFSSFASTSFTGKLDTGSFNQDNIRTLGILTGLQIANATPNINLIDTTITAPGLDTSLVTEKAVVDYVATNPTSETLAEVLANGNQSGGVNSIDMTGAVSNVTFIDSIDPANPTSRAQGRATFGTGNDLQIYFDGTDGHIEQTNDANLIISGKEIKIQTSQLASTEDMIKAVSDGEVILYHNGTDKIQTSSTGVSVNGVIKTSDGANNGPSYSFTSATNTGMYSPATNEIEFVTNGAARLKISSTGLGVTGAIDASSSIEGLSFTTDTTSSSALMTRFILSTDGIANFSNNTMVPTTQAVKEYADAAVGTSTLSYQGDAATTGTQPFSLNLATGTFDVTGGSNISTTSTAVAGNIGIITVNLDDAVTITGKMEAGTLSDGTFSGIAGTYTGGVSIESDTFTATTTPVGFIGNATTASALLSSGAIALSGDTSSTGGPHTYTSGGAVTIPTTIANTTVTGKTLDGYSAGTAGAIGANDTILQAFTKLQASITATSGLTYEGTWNANTDTPALSGTTPNNGVFYIVSFAGNTSLSGITDWKVGDWAIYVSNGSATDGWQKLDQTNEISGSGAVDKIAKWSTSNTLGTGLISDNGSTVSIGDTGSFEVLGNTTLGNADTDTTVVKGPAHFEETLRADVGIGLGGATYGSSGQVLTSGGGAASVNTWTTPTVGEVVSVTSGTGVIITGTAANPVVGLRYNDSDNSGTIKNFIEAATTGVPEATDLLLFGEQAGGSAINIVKKATISSIVDLGNETLAQVLNNGNTTGGTDIAVGAGDDITFTDTSKAIFGGSSDLQLYHDTSNSYIETTSGSAGDLYIKAQGTGHDLYLQATDDVLIRPKGGENGIKVIGDGAIELYYNNLQKLTTTTEGIEIGSSTSTTNAVIDMSSPNAAGGGSSRRINFSNNAAASTPDGSIQYNVASSGVQDFTIGFGGNDDTVVKILSASHTITNNLVVASKTGVAGSGSFAGSVSIGVSSPISGFNLDVQGGDFRVGDDANQGFEAGYSAGGGNVFIQGYNRGTSAFVDMIINNSLTILAGGNSTFSGNVELKSNPGGATKFLRIWNEGTVDATDDALITWQTQLSRTYSMGIHRDSGLLTITNQDASVASGELITVDTSGNTVISGDLTVNGSIIHGGGGGGTAKGGIFTKLYTTGNAGVGEVAFTIDRATTGTMVFDVMFTGDTSTATSVAKKYTVIATYGATAPIYNKILDSGPDANGGEFGVAFADDTSNTKIKCTITPFSINTQKIGITIDLGFGQNDATVVMN